MYKVSITSPQWRSKSLQAQEGLLKDCALVETGSQPFLGVKSDQLGLLDAEQLSADRVLEKWVISRFSRWRDGRRKTTPRLKFILLIPGDGAGNPIHTWILVLRTHSVWTWPSSLCTPLTPLPHVCPLPSCLPLEKSLFLLPILTSCLALQSPCLDSLPLGWWLPLPYRTARLPLAANLMTYWPSMSTLPNYTESDLFLIHKWITSMSSLLGTLKYFT